MRFSGTCALTAMSGKSKRRGVLAYQAQACCASACLIAVLLLAGCFGYTPPPLPLGPSPTVTPNAGPGVAADGETAEQAAKRLFPRAYRQALEAAESRSERELLEGTTPGEPAPLAVDYETGGRMLVQWVLPDDLHAATGNMFAAMWPIAMLKDGFVVPMVKDGRSVSEFGICLNDHGRWVLECEQGWIGFVPGGWVRGLQRASEKLEKLLGPGTIVRPVMFVPSGLAFAVGDNQGREAAVFLSWVEYGPGVEGFHKQFPEVGQLYTPAQLKKLLTP